MSKSMQRQGGDRQQVVMAAQTHFSGPLPAPQDLAAYEAITAGLANRIVLMAENQATHRQTMEAKIVVSESNRAWGGLIVGGVVALAALAAATWAITQGHGAAGAVIATGDLVALVSVFVVGRRGQGQPPPPSK